MASRNPSISRRDEELLQDWRRIFEPARKKHEELERYWKRWRKAYRAVVEPQDQKFSNTLKPKHVYQIIELIAANIIDDQPRAQIVPEGPQDVEGAKQLEKLLNEQARRDYLDEKIVPWVKQAIETNLSPAKIGWEYRAYDKKYRSYDVFGREQVEQKHYVEFDQPTFVPIPVDDFFFDPAGFRPDEWAHAHHRTYQTMDELRAEEKAERFRNIDLVSDTRSLTESSDSSATLKLDRRGRIELIETWYLTPEGLQMMTVANRTVVVRDETNLFWHGKLPFVLATAIPDMNDPFTFSVIEAICEDADVYALHLQQLLDNAEAINNARLDYNEHTIDPQRIQNRPRGLTPRGMNPDDIRWNYPPVNIIDSGQKILEMLLTNMRDISGATAYLSGASNEGLNQDTATGISLIQNMAQLRMLMLKNTVAASGRRAGQQKVELNKQFMKRPMLVAKPGAQDSWDFDQIADPATIAKCEARYEVEDAAKTLDRQKARNEATVLLQVWQGLAAQLNVPGSGVWVDLAPAAKMFLEAYQVKDAEAWLVETQPQQVAVPGPPQPQPEASPPPPQLGVPAAGGEAPSPTPAAAAGLPPRPSLAAGNGAQPQGAVSGY